MLYMVQPELTDKEVKRLKLINCDKCNRKVTEQTLNYKHQVSCTGNNPKQPQTKDIKVEPLEDIEYKIFCSFNNFFVFISLITVAFLML